MGAPGRREGGRELADGVNDEVTGLFVPTRDSAALRTSIDGLLSERGLRERLGVVARAAAGEALSRRVEGGRFLDVYGAAVEGS